MYRTDSLLTQIQAVLDQNLSDPDFSIPEFCDSLNISRTHLHRKLIELTGLSTSHYIRQLRLEMAKDLLETSDLLVYEAAYKVGFKDVAYFSSSFSSLFGYPPKALKGHSVLNY